MKKVADKLFQICPHWVIVVYFVLIVAIHLAFLDIAPKLERLLRTVRVVGLGNHTDSKVPCALDEGIN